MLTIEKLGETDSSVVFCVNGTHLFEYPKAGSPEDIALLADTFEAWVHHLRTKVTF
jgi:hypothetical protein